MKQRPITPKPISLAKGQRFASLTIAQVDELLASAAFPEAATNTAFYGGDHWQDGKGWIGPMPTPTNPDGHEVYAAIQRAFTPSNAIAEVVDRHASSVVGREPAWSLTVRRSLAPGKQPMKAEQALIAEAEALLTEWWDARGVAELLRELVVQALLAERAGLRLFVPAGRRDQEGRISTGDLASMLDLIHVEVTPIGSAAILIDLATLQRCSAHCYKRDDVTYVELSYVDGDETVLRVLASNAADPQEIRLPIGRNLLLAEVLRPALISEPIRLQQKLLNLAYTMLGRNVVQGGFLERIIKNAKRPGYYEDDPDRPGERRFVSLPFRTGAGTTNMLEGLEIRDEAGNVTGYTTPDITYRDPVKVDTFVQTKAEAEQAILKETRQMHALISGDATASGESRKQARADFADSLEPTALLVNQAGRWLLETALALAAHLAKQPGRFAGLRAVFTCRINTGPLSGDEQREIIDQVDAELLDDETAMSRLGVEDVDAVKAKIATRRAERQAVAQAQQQPAGQQTPQTPQPNPQPGQQAQQQQAQQ
ncbi:MAG TPA: hypothetical protein VFS21_30175 [Roseiflexaceae bacterium]|nr:hypothetical protein [Roseiflexaceae bacterium]